MVFTDVLNIIPYFLQFVQKKCTNKTETLIYGLIVFLYFTFHTKKTINNGKKVLLIMQIYHKNTQCFTVGMEIFQIGIDISNISLYNKHMDYINAVGQNKI